MKKIFFICLLLSTLHLSYGQNIITTIAGNDTVGFSGDGGPATNAKMYLPTGITMDVYGNIYFADYGNYRIRKISPAGIITTIGGNGSIGYSGDGGPATDATFSSALYGIAVDASGNVYIADRDNNVIREIFTTGIIKTIAGTGSIGFSGDGGPATAAAFWGPEGVTLDHFGNIYISDASNNRIRKINSSGIVSTIAGNGSGGFSGDGGPATDASLLTPSYTTISSTGEIYISDVTNNRIRKISTSGIISTVAGNGTYGSSGDGGMATAAELYSPGAIALDGFDNLYIASYAGVRKVDLSGIITTFAGNGALGYSGDGGPATAAELNGPWGITFDRAFNLNIADFDNSVIRKVQNLPAYTADSFTIFINKKCSGPEITDVPTQYTTGMTIKTFFGDGTADSSAISSSGNVTIDHVYASNGTYTIKQLLYRSSALVDSFRFTYNYVLCNAFSVQFYYDANSNCVFDAGDVVVTQPVLIEVDSNGVATDTISTTSGIYYTAYGSAGDVYGFKVISAPAGFTVTCPGTGIVYDTLGTSIYAAPVQNIGMRCTSATDFDLSVNAIIPGSGVNDESADIYVQNSYCIPTNATVTVHYSNLYAGTPTSISPSPTTVAGDSIVWNVSGLSADLSAPVHLHYQVWAGGTPLTIGDTVKSYFSITPMAGDADTSNNTQVIVDTVKAGCDPNEMWVNPPCFDYTPGTTQLKYTINFENTGNDTAHNIYVLDTLSDLVNPSTLKMVMASNEMHASKFRDAAGHNIFKFDFPGINLLDSSHHGQCDGALIFNVNTQAALPLGTHIVNRAGIYFDVNPVVMTNTATTTVGCPGYRPDRLY